MDHSHSLSLPDAAPTLGPLAARAYLLLRESGHPLDEATLIAHCFGVKNLRGGPTSWSSHLSRLLKDPLFYRRPDALWALAIWGEQREDRLDTTEYIVVDVETTGLQPQKDRIIEVAALRLRGSEIIETFESLLNPSRRIPSTITRFTGISNDMAADAPTAAEIMPSLLAFIGRTPLAGHNIRFDLNFLVAEAARCELGTLPNVTLDTCRLAPRVIPGLGRPSLDRLCAALGISTQGERRHRALVDARLTAQALIQLIDRGQAQGITTFSALCAVAGPAQKASQSTRPLRHGQEVVRAMRRDLPARPGVYLMKNALGSVVYVGKAKSLKNRVSSYGHAGEYKRKTDALMETVTSIETIEVGSELEALLLESRLIKHYLPLFNVQQRYYRQYAFVKVDVDTAYPRVSVSREFRNDGGRYFGPYRTGRVALTLVDIIQRIFPVRTCTRMLLAPAAPGQSAIHATQAGKKSKGRAANSPHCLRYYLNRCMGPCRTYVPVEDYRKVIDDVTNFLSGSSDEMLDRMVAERERASAREDFERAGQINQMITQARRLFVQQNLLSGAVERHNLLIVAPSVADSSIEIFGICHSRLTEQVRLPLVGEGLDATALLSLRALIQRLSAAPPPPPTIGNHEVDAIHIIAGWIHRHDGDPTFVPIPRQTSEKGLEATETNLIVAQVNRAIHCLREVPFETEIDDPVNDDEQDYDGGKDLDNDEIDIIAIVAARQLS